jgi:hypothetical protein
MLQNERIKGNHTLFGITVMWVLRETKEATIKCRSLIDLVRGLSLIEFPTRLIYCSRKRDSLEIKALNYRYKVSIEARYMWCHATAQMEYLNSVFWRS